MMFPPKTYVFSVVLATVLTLAVSAEGARAEDEIVTNIDKANAMISGSRERVWIEETVVGALSGNGCERGVRYRFRSDETMAKETCIDGAWDIADGSWSLSDDENGLLVLTLGATRYTATLVRRADSLEFAILDLPDEKTADTTEIVLRYMLD